VEILFSVETSMIQLSQTLMKMHHASSIRPIKDKLFTDENNSEFVKFTQTVAHAIKPNTDLAGWWVQ
jgi:hypothetical protein